MVLRKLANYKAPCVVLGKDRLWWVFLFFSIGTPLVLAIVVLAARISAWIDFKRKNKDVIGTQLNLKRELRYGPKLSWDIGECWRWFKNMPSGEEHLILAQLRNASNRIVSLRYLSGALVLLLAFIISMCSLFIYFGEVSFFMNDVEQCQPWTNNVGQQTDFVFNIFFLVYYLLRFMAADEKIVMIFNIYSIIDYFTVVPAFVGVALDRRWIGLRFLRSIYLRKVSTILSALNIITSSAKLKLLQLGLTWVAILLTAGGFLHLLENSGDFFYTDWNGQRITYWDYSYLAFTTMSTIGGAPLNITTVLGKLSNCILVFIVLAVICFAIPDVKNMMGSQLKWSGDHRSVHNERHIIVCGDVSHESVYGVFQELFHPDRDVHDIKIVCLGPAPPGLEYNQFLKRNTWRIAYLQGSVLNGEDLRRAKLTEADACMILANKTAIDPDAEDSSNIMCVVAVKNYHHKVRVVVQLMQYRSKTYLTSIPNWDPSVGDDVICLPEIKLGLMAQSAIAPGLSTLVANLFAARSGHSGANTPEHMEKYLAGAGMEMYTERFSNSFIGLTFLQAVETCYKKLDLLLFAVSADSSTQNGLMSQAVHLNPHRNFIIKTGVSGCFIADSAHDVQRALYYCSLCHANTEQPDDVHPCDCDHDASKESMRSSSRKPLQGLGDVLAEARNSARRRRGSTRSRDAAFPMSSMDHIDYFDDEETPLPQEAEEDLQVFQEMVFSSFEAKIVYYMKNFGSLDNWLKSDMNEVIYDEEGKILDFSGGPRFDSTGMFWWCPPRAFSHAVVTRFEAAHFDFKNHVVVIVFADEKSSVLGLNNLIMPLRSSTFTYEELPDVVILGDPKFLVHEWPAIINFPKLTVVKVSGLNRADLRAVNIDKCRQCLVLSSSSRVAVVDNLLSDINPILTTLTIKAMNFGPGEDRLDDTVPILAPDRLQNGSTRKPWNPSKHQEPHDFDEVFHGYSIPMLTELVNDSNVAFVDQDDDDINEFFLAEPFICGTAFATSVLQALMVSTYFNPYCLAVLRALIFGGVTPEFEQILAEGAGLIGGPNLSSDVPHGDRCRVVQISVRDSRFNDHSKGRYGPLFLDGVRNHGMIILGLYRKIMPSGQGPRSVRRYVIANPPKEFLVLPHDRIFAIERVKNS